MNAKSMKLDYKEVKNVSNELLLSNDYYKNMAGLFILIGINTGLRSIDILSLKKNNFILDGKNYLLTYEANKTGKKTTISISQLIYSKCMAMPTNEIFYNTKRNSMFTHTWINRILKSIFYKQHSIAQKQGSVISVHSLRKTAGTYVYNNKGLEVARSFLQHENYDMTKKYLEIDKMELIDITADLFA
jgi:integrase